MPAEGRKRSMVIVHRQQRHTFSAYNPRTLLDACSSVCNLCSFDAIARDTRYGETELDWDGAVWAASPRISILSMHVMLELVRGQMSLNCTVVKRIP